MQSTSTLHEKEREDRREEGRGCRDTTSREGKGKLPFVRFGDLGMKSSIKEQNLSNHQIYARQIIVLLSGQFY